VATMTQPILDKSGEVARVTLAVKIAIGVVAPLIGFLAALGGIASFATLRHLAVPWFGSSAWVVPVGIDVGILALIAWDLIAEYLGIPWPVLRWTAWAFIAGTVYLNIAAAHGNSTPSVMHAAMPVLFIVVAEGVRHLIRQLTGLAAGTYIERIPLTRWLFAPRSTFLLRRRMVLWQVTSYRQALTLEYQRLRGVARLQTEHGRYLWRWRAPLAERLSLRFECTGLAFDSVPLDEGETQSPEAPDNPDRLLIDAATEILRDASSRGTRISQGTLAKRLRAQGHAIANDRLGWLMQSALSGPLEERPVP